MQNASGILRLRDEERATAFCSKSCSIRRRSNKPSNLHFADATPDEDSTRVSLNIEKFRELYCIDCRHIINGTKKRLITPDQFPDNEM
jgi:hypothetical protein